MDIRTAIQRSIVAAWAADAWLTANCPTLNFARVPKGGEKVHAVFYLRGDTSRNQAGDVGIYELQFNAFANDPATATAILTKIKGLFLNEDKTPKALALEEGFVNTGAPRAEAEDVFENETERWQATILFKLSAGR
jgi:hypothetical protein